MEFAEVVRGRRMCRDFADRPVDPALVDRLLDAARRAPSAGHTQGWAFVVLEGREQTARFWHLDADPAWLARPDHPGLLRAPVVVVPVCSPDAYLQRYSEHDKLSGAPGRSQREGWPAPYWTIDAAMATMSLLLAATDAGLGALLFALHRDPTATLAGLGVPAGWEAVGALAIGWPAVASRGATAAGGSSVRRGRRPWDEVVHRGGW